MNPLTPFFAFIARKRSERIVRTAERQRSALIEQIADRRAHHREWKPMLNLLRQSTEASLRASVSRHLPKQEVR